MLSNAIEVKKRTVKNNQGLVIGIDPDLVKSGVAVSFNGSLSQLYALSFPELLEFAKDKYAEHGDRVEFIVEEVEADKTTYQRAGMNQNKMRKIAQNVGQVKGTKRVLVDCFNYYGIPVRLVRPLRGEYKKQAKNDAKYFNRITGWTGSSNEDKRDAALLALFG